MKHIVFTVINDLTFDQRMQRICRSLVAAGFRVTLIGRRLPESKPLTPQPFAQRRLNLWFRRGKLFYLEYNLRLFFHLLTHRYDIYGATDLDTLLPQFLAAKLKGKPHTYDAHEYFSELPEIVGRPWVKWAWKRLEQWIVPRTRYAYTINETYANFFWKEYGVHFLVVRNATVLRPLPLPLPTPTVRYVLYQGAVNVGRGIEEMIQAMQQIDCLLYICGHGDVFDECVQLTKDLDLQNKVIFFGRVPPNELIEITRQATLGFTFFTEHGESYYYSLANRFFDYFHNGIPQLCSNFPEYRAVNERFGVALLLDDLNPTTIAEAVNQLLNDTDLYNQLRENCLQAREVLHWGEEERKLVALYQSITN